MPFNRLATIVAPIGAAGMLTASLTPYLVMVTISGLLETPEDENESAGNFTIIALIGLAGACLLSVGMVIAARQRLRPTLPARASLLVATVAFGLAVLLIAYGNTQMMSAFMKVATAETIDADVLFRDAHRATIPILIGYISVLAGATAVFCASLATLPKAASTRSSSGCFALITVLGGSFLLCLATLWTASSVYAFERLVSIAAQVDPSEVAGSVSGIILSVYLSLFGLAGFSLASLLWCIAKGPANYADVENTGSRGDHS